MIFDKSGMRLNNNERVLKWGQIKSPVDVKINRFLRLKAASPRYDSILIPNKYRFLRSILLFYEGGGEKYHLNLAEARSRVAVITSMGNLNNILGQASIFLAKFFENILSEDATTIIVLNESESISDNIEPVKRTH